ncbi:MAG: hypothetical protein DLM59_07200 [Pseudonocardiales bacterium]|nr:MAG: hypothetical protein DLM59_07200 [Pseudonocardiales bacterium]
MDNRPHDRSDLFEKLANLEGRPTGDFPHGDCRQPRAGDGTLPTRHITRAIRSSARLLAFDLLNAACGIAERRLFALVDSTASLLAHGGSEETARLALESVVGPPVARAAVHALLGDG